MKTLFQFISIFACLQAFAFGADTTVKGCVVLSNGDPPGAFTVEGIASGRSAGTSQTNADGSFTFTLPEAAGVKRFSLIISKTGYRSNVTVNLLTAEKKNQHSISVELRLGSQDPESKRIEQLIYMIKGDKSGASF